MSRRLSRHAVVALLRREPVRKWLALFGIGAMLGAALLLIRLSLSELRGASSAQLAYIEKQARSEPREIASVPLSETAEGLRQPIRVDTERREEQPSREEPVPEKEAKEPAQVSNALDNMIVRIYLTKEKRIEKVPLETYIRGVVAGEMPIEFELEALKAQAIAARTYIVRRLAGGENEGAPRGADVTDTVEHQVYVPLAELAGKWPKTEQRANMSKLGDAIDQTRGLVVTYEGKPIEAVFFSTSNGYTENSEDYWEQKLPYLRSVESPWDESISPKYKETVKLSLNDFLKKLGVKRNGSSKPKVRIVEKTEGNRIGEIEIGGKLFTGRQVRERLGLASSQFTWTIKGDTITITTYGYGHGVGMSQWGANGMAREGANAETILGHYYSSTKLEPASNLFKRLPERS